MISFLTDTNHTGSEKRLPGALWWYIDEVAAYASGGAASLDKIYLGELGIVRERDACWFGVSKVKSITGCRSVLYISGSSTRLVHVAEREFAEHLAAEGAG